MKNIMNKIIVPRQKVNKMAFELSCLNYSYDRLAWKLADLRCKYSQSIKERIIENYKNIVLLFDNSMVRSEDYYEKEHIKRKIYNDNTPIQELHWFIAELSYLHLLLTEDEATASVPPGRGTAFSFVQRLHWEKWIDF